MKNRENSEQIFCLMPKKTPKFSELTSVLKPNLAKIFPNPVLTSNRIIQGPSSSRTSTQIAEFAIKALLLRDLLDMGLIIASSH